jgi:hypothetical protein
LEPPSDAFTNTSFPDDGLKNGVRIGLMAGCTSCSEGADGELRL